MSKLNFSFKFLLLTLFFCASIIAVFAQDEKKALPPDELQENAEDDVLKINTNLIQIGVGVFDKKGNFVNNLKSEDFELLVDEKPIPILFFEQNIINKSDKTKQNAASKLLSNNPDKPNEPGRNIIFMVDDFHLSFASHHQVKKLISKFIDQEMKPQDTVAIVSPTGQIGFLQQFINDKKVLQIALERLVYKRDSSVNDRLVPPMSEYEAFLISRYDREVTDLFASKEFGGMDMESKREIVRSRARDIMLQAALVNRGTYSTLEQAIRNSARLTGRKIVFFFSDGFLLDPSNTDSPYRMQRITDAAARTNAVIYSFDAKGLETNLPEGTTAGTTFGFRIQSGKSFESQDGLSLLANETGGRFVRNTNDLQTGLSESLEEASQHYLLAWEPDSENGKAEKLRKIKVRVKNRPELLVRMQAGYLNENSEIDSVEKVKTKKGNATNAQVALSIPERQLNTAINAATPVQMLPISLVVNYLDVPNEGMTLSAAMQIEGSAVEFTQEGKTAKANLDILGIIYDSNGRREGFLRKLLTAETPASALSNLEQQKIYFNHQTKLKPGLYQLRVAARDVKSGRIGSAVKWLEIPDLSSRRLATSSLIISERKIQTETLQENELIKIAALELPLNVELLFDRSSHLRYMVYIYNSSLSKSKTNQPNISVQTQILQGNKVIMSSSLPVNTEGQDPMRLGFVAEIPLNSLSAGHYELQVTAQDNATKSNAVQRVNFEVR